MQTRANLPKPKGVEVFSNKLFDASGVLWFAIAILGQWIFAFYILLHFGGLSVKGDFKSISEGLMHGIIAGDFLGNLAFAVHVFLAFVVLVGGPLQLIPYIRIKAIRLHRINGRIYIITAFLISAAGLFMNMSRGAVGGSFMALGNSINAMLIMYCAYMTFQTARQRKINLHHKWAWRTYIVMSGVWFFRLGFGLWIFVNNGSAPGSSPDLTGPFDRFLALAHTLLPITILELYFWVKENNRIYYKLPMGFLIIGLSVLTAIGIFMASMIFWLPELR